jgi:hypothetical protein
MNYKISRHAKEEFHRRQIPIRIVREVLINPGQILSQGNNKKIYQSKITFEGGKIYLVRVFVDEGVRPPVVITAYRTTKIADYWEMSHEG